MIERISFIFQPERIFRLNISIAKLISFILWHWWFFDKMISCSHIFVNSLSEINLLSSCFSDRYFLILYSVLNILSNFVIFIYFLLCKHSILILLIFLKLFCNLFNDFCFIFLFPLIL